MFMIINFLFMVLFGQKELNNWFSCPYNACLYWDLTTNSIGKSIKKLLRQYFDTFPKNLRIRFHN